MIRFYGQNEMQFTHQTLNWIGVLMVPSTGSKLSSEYMYFSGERGMITLSTDFIISWTFRLDRRRAASEHWRSLHLTSSFRFLPCSEFSFLTARKKGKENFSSLTFKCQEQNSLTHFFKTEKIERFIARNR